MSAHANGDKADALNKRLKEVRDDHDDAQLRVTGLERRVAAAEQDVGRHQSEHAKELLDELEPQALKVRDRIVRLIGELVAADGEWGAMLARVNELVVAMGADPRRDIPERHQLAGAIRELRKAADAVSTLTPPLPHFAGRAAQQREEKTAQLLRLRRKSRPTEADEAEMARFRRELNASEAPAA